MSMEKGEFIYWLDGFTSSKTKLSAEDVVLVKSMLNQVLNRKPVVTIEPSTAPNFLDIEMP